MEMDKILRESFEKMSKEELIENCIENINRLSVFDDFLATEDITQQFIDYIESDIEFHEENNNEFLADNHSWELQKQMIREYQS